MTAATRPRIRCAIYTRKSSDEGLDQDFNSLDAQHEACSAYIASQRHEGWVLDKTRYDDGGISGGTLKRPALKQLLTDIDSGRIQMIVVYKIDRLTRSLADFAKLVERLDHGGLFLCLGDASLQHRILHGPPDAQCTLVLRSVRTRSHS